MKLAEALVLRADLQKKLENLKKRLANSVRKLDDIQVIEVRYSPMSRPNYHKIKIELG